jgi:23S rRNA (uracil1939-C5)-methyltransferase
MTRGRREPETAHIESVTHDGRGIAALPGKKVFVAGALPGENVRFQRRKRRRNFDEAQLLEVLEASNERIEPRCAVYGTCGGCSLQHTSDEAQRDIKLKALADNLERIGKVEPQRWLEPIYDDSQNGSWHYRRRARLAVKDVAGKGRVLVGFRERHAPYLTDMHRCEVIAKPVDGLLDPLSDLIGNLSIRRRVPQIEVAIADNATALLFRVLDPPTDDDRAALTAFAIEHGVRLLLQTGGLDSVTPLWPQPPLESLCYGLPDFDITINFDASDFVQINARVNQRMVSEALHLLQIGADDRVLDLYCGIGNFSLPMARKAHHVLGIEGEMHLVQRARNNALENGIDNCEFLCTDLTNVEGNESWLSAGWDRVLLDPARSGAAAVVSEMNRIGAGRIVYVSCNPGTLARDAETLVHAGGYTLEAAGIIDMFPHTGHVESLAVFQKGQ